MTSGFAALLAAVLLFAGANAYTTSYHPFASSEADFAPPAGEPEVRQGSGDVRRDISGMFADGYGLIGGSEFTGAQNAKDAARQARKVGADVVVMSSGVRETETGEDTVTVTSAEFATYYRRMRRTKLGLFFFHEKPKVAPPPGETLGLVVASVRRESPAFQARVQVGDILTSMNGKRVFDRDSLTAAMPEPGKVELSLVRSGKPIVVTAILPDGEW